MVEALVPVGDRSAILKKLLELPDERILASCDTKDRQNLFRQTRDFYYLVFEALSAYFRGESWKPEPSVEDDIRASVGLKINYYLAFYQVIWSGWDLIEQHWDAARQVFRLDEEQTCPSSPGFFLSVVLEEEALGILSAFFPEWRSGNSFESYSPRQDFQNISELRKLRSQNRDSLRRAQKDKLKRLEELEYQKFERSMAFHRHERLALFIVQKAKRKTPALRLSFDFLCEACEKLEAVYDAGETLKLRLSHPSRRVRGFDIRRGNKVSKPSKYS